MVYLQLALQTPHTHRARDLVSVTLSAASLADLKSHDHTPTEGTQRWLDVVQLDKLLGTGDCRHTHTRTYMSTTSTSLTWLAVHRYTNRVPCDLHTYARTHTCMHRCTGAQLATGFAVHTVAMQRLYVRAKLVCLGMSVFTHCMHVCLCACMQQCTSEFTRCTCSV